jgi:hypothetical protein
VIETASYACDAVWLGQDTLDSTSPKRQRSIPPAEFALCTGENHFAPLQRSRQFKAVILEFVAEVLPREISDGARRSN